MLRRAVLLFCLQVGMLAEACGQVAEAWNRLMATEGLRHAVVGVSVKSVTDGRALFERWGEKAMQPASVCKLLSTALAMKERGMEFRYHTPVWTTGRVVDSVLYGDVIVGGTGDPTLSSRYFPSCDAVAQLADAIQKLGIRRIRGGIRVEPSCRADIPGSWQWEDISNYYGAVCSPFNYSDNAFFAVFRTGRTGEPAELLRVEPEQPGVRIVNEVMVASGGGDNAYIYGGPYSSELHVTGTLPPGKETYRVRGAMHRPDRCFMRAVTERLEKEGVMVENAAVEEEGQEKRLEFVSPTLKDIVRETNKKSINLFAEAMGRLVDSADYPARCRALLDEMGIGGAGVSLKDACGLSAANAAPPVVFTDLLVWAHKALGWGFVGSLPLGGTDAGLNPYVATNPRLKNKLRAKTGTISGVRALSGYLTTDGGGVLAFTLLINHFDGPASAIQRHVGAFLCSLL